MTTSTGRTAIRGRKKDRSLPLVLVAVVLSLASLAMFWPGVALYDTVRQYEQVLSGSYDDWHPPVMARLWAVVAAFGPGAAPMLVVQLGGYWIGFALLAAALAARGYRRRGVAMLGIGAFPVFLGWQGVVLKDAQMAAALLAAVGIVGWWRLRDRRVPRGGWALVVMLAAYAVLVRANALFAVVPLMVLLTPWRGVVRVVVGVVALGATLVLSPIVNHRLLGAGASGVERTQAVYDLAGIAVRVAPGSRDVGLAPDAVRAIDARHCVTPFFWDPLGDAGHCEAAMARVRAMPVGALYAMLAGAVMRHPFAYAGHRIAHWNATERWLVPRGRPSAAPSSVSEPNTIGLASPGRLAEAWQAIAGALVVTPLGWPIAWLVVAITALAIAVARPVGGARDMAVALLGSAILLETSFGVLSIASDLRYHLWPMTATALAVVLVADRLPGRRAAVAGGIALAIVVGGGLAARIILPPSPTTYAGMLG